MNINKYQQKMFCIFMLRHCKLLGMIAIMRCLRLKLKRNGFKLMLRMLAVCKANQIEK